MTDAMRLLQEALGGVQTGRTVFTAASKEELLEKVTAALRAEQVESQEDDDINQVVEAMNPQLAADFATADLLKATQEFNRGHYGCADRLMNKGSVWLALSEHLLTIEKWEREEADREQRESAARAEFAEGWGDLRTPEQKAAEEQPEPTQPPQGFTNGWLTGSNSGNE